MSPSGLNVIASLFIIAASSALFVYWFRYTCLLLLGQKTAEVGSENYALKVTSTIRLSFPHLQRALRDDSQEFALDTLHEGLASDYRILTDLLRQFTSGDSIEHRILLIDYKLMGAWYSLTRAPKALMEMSLILNYFASEIGESAAC